MKTEILLEFGSVGVRQTELPNLHYWSSREASQECKEAMPLPAGNKQRQRFFRREGGTVVRS